jgi:hypothetical protein
MELRTWILDDHRNVLTRLRGQIFERVPAERLSESYSVAATPSRSKPVTFHVMWETIGHGYTHVGELVHLRSRLGAVPIR